ncbi:hypothetical protein KY346_00115 [Candidatus Woesearchaeota archaeon]|nr:hypothetical protein [Candidatus Woesearchaeota archaeon]
MGVSYKNIWSLNTDEAVVTGKLRGATPKNIEVFIPVNAQMKDIDLMLINTTNKKFKTIQVKGSRAYEPKKKEMERYGEGSTGWFFLEKKIIHRCSADYFIFLVYAISEDKEKGRRKISPHIITIPTGELIKLCKKYKKPHPSRYSFYFWVNPKKKTATEWRDKEYDVTQYLDKKGLSKLMEEIK